MRNKKISAVILILCMLISIFNFGLGTFAQSSSSERDYKVQISGFTLTKDHGYQPTKSFTEKKYKQGEKGVYIIAFSGPIYDYMKTGVEKEGAVLKDFLPEHSFSALMTVEAVEKVKGLPYVLDVLVYQPEFKVDPKLKEKLSSKSDNEDADLVVKFFDTPANFETQADKMNVKINSRSGKKAVIKAKLGKIKEISEIPDVQYIELKSEYKLCNDIARGMIQGSTSSNWDTLYNGTGEIVGVADTGLDTGVNDNTMHQDLRGRINQIFNWCNDSTKDYNGHGTHVSGSIVGTGAASNGKYKGTAPGASLVFQAVENDSSGDLEGLPTDLNQLFQQAYDAGARVHSNSWGDMNFGTYTEKAQDVDEFMWNHKDMTILFCAGNYGSSGIINPGTAKNCITVGATESFRPKDDVFNVTQSDNTHEVASFSSQGWCNDGRIKPDIVSPGTFIISAKSSLARELYWPCLQNSNYQYMCGTSMATPLTAGAVAVARQYIKTNYNDSNPSAALMKAIFINGATDIGYGVPSKLQGWGKTNLSNSTNQLSSAGRFFDDQSTSLSTGGKKTYTVNVAASNEPLKITLTWTDYPAASEATKALVNDLDLKVTSPNGTIYYGNDFTSPFNSDSDRINNVENIFINNPVLGNYTVEVIGYEIPHGPQNFALVSSNSFMPVVSNIMATTTTSSINLTWDTVPGATSYDVTIDGSTTVNRTTNSYQHTGLQSATAHTYKVRAKNSTLTGSYSYTATFYTNMVVPPNLKVSEISNSSVKLSWDICPGALWYLVDMEGKTKRITENTIQYDNLISGKTYNFRVKAFTDNNCSDWNTIQPTMLNAGLNQINDLPTRRMGLDSCEAGGKIYAIGGSDGSTYLNTVECFNTSTGLWENKTGMANPRNNLAVVSSGSKIYAIGGYNGTVLKKLEAYDVNTNSWTTLADMPTARQFVSAALVNGKIYVIGGFDGTNSLKKVEVYNIATNTWQTLTDMPTARYDFGLTVAGNKLYAVGGRINSSTATNTVEIYDTTTNIWSTGIPMPTARYGLRTVTINNRIYAMCGIGSSAIDEFDITNGTWSSKSSIPISRGSFGAAVYNGIAYIIGGYGNATYYKSCYQYDPNAHCMVENLPLPDSRYGYGSAQLNGKIYISGGTKSYLDTTTGLYTWRDTNDLLMYDPANNSWTSKTPMSANRVYHRMVALDGKLYAIGGDTAGPVVEAYDPVSDTWSPRESLGTPRRNASVIVYDNKIYVFGGYAGGIELNSVESYNPMSDLWSPKANMPSGVTSAGVAQVNGKIYILCGRSQLGYNNFVYEYDPLSGTWATKQSIGDQVSSLGASVLGKKIYLFGGQVDGGIFRASIKEYDPVTQAYTEIHRFPLDAQRANLSCVSLNGKIYVIGGDKVPEQVKTSQNFDIRNDVAYKNNYAFYNPVWCSDLTLDNLTWTPSTVYTGNSVTFSATIRNIGSQATPKGVVHKVHFYVDGIEKAWSDNYTSSITPGQSVTVTANSPAWAAILGQHTITAKVELVSSTHENDVNNNTFEKLMVVN